MSAFVTSDLHLGHEKILTFLAPDGTRLRPFSSIDEMHNTLITNWNNKVHTKDRVYILGDVAIPRKGLELLNEFNGKKILIRGNHDVYKLSDYAKYFEDVQGARYRDGLLFTHVPVHPACLSERYYGNVHGHLHIHLVRTEAGEVDKKYFNACVERNNFTPVHLDEVREYFNLPRLG